LRSSLAGLTPGYAFQQSRNLIVRDGRDPQAGARFRKRVHRLEIIERLTRATSTSIVREACVRRGESSTIDRSRIEPDGASSSRCIARPMKTEGL